MNGSNGNRPADPAVWVVGSSNLDTTYRVDVIPKTGQTIGALARAVATGGKGANQAIAIRHWGVPVRFVGAVGDDDAGAALLRNLAEAGVDTEHVSTVTEEDSGSAVVLVNPQGDNCIVVHAGANRRIDVELISRLDLRQYDVVVAQLEVNTDAVFRAFYRAKRVGAKTILNPSPIIGSARELLSATDTLIANADEAGRLGANTITDLPSAIRCAKSIQAKGPPEVVLTLGNDGAIVATQNGVFHAPGCSVEAIDTQGAGDAFLGAFVARQAIGYTVDRALSFANAVAAYSVTVSGSTQVSLPRAEHEVGHLLRETLAI